MIGFYIAANVGKYLFRSSAKYGYTGLIGGGLISKAGRGVGMAVRGKYQKLGDAIYEFFNEGGIGHSLLAGSTKARTVNEMADSIVGGRGFQRTSIWGRKYRKKLGIDTEVMTEVVPIVNKISSGGRTTIREHRKLINFYADSKLSGNSSLRLSRIGIPSNIEDIVKASRATVSQHNKRFVKAGLVTVGSAYIASLTSRKAFEAMQAVESNALNFAASIGEYEAVRAIPMMNTMQATTERAAALQYIQQSRTNARSLLGQEAALRHGV